MTTDKKKTETDWNGFDTDFFRVMFGLMHLYLLGYLVVLFPHHAFNHDLHNACNLWHLNYKPQTVDH